ncbi:hypothetical protein HDU76_002079 [Blyttiomyces sp. JEL0837]|nr:hypothetical protein HDU76_002079 [Blyttiomyces sp. JEL0837]
MPRFFNPTVFVLYILVLTTFNIEQSESRVLPRQGPGISNSASQQPPSPSPSQSSPVVSIVAPTSNVATDSTSPILQSQSTQSPTISATDKITSSSVIPSPSSTLSTLSTVATTSAMPQTTPITNQGPDIATPDVTYDGWWTWPLPDGPIKNPYGTSGSVTFYPAGWNVASGSAGAGSSGGGVLSSGDSSGVVVGGSGSGFSFASSGVGRVRRGGLGGDGLWKGVYLMVGEVGWGVLVGVVVVGMVGVEY